MSSLCFPACYGGMSLSKIPFIFLATWGIHITISSPNPPLPHHASERFPSSLVVPLENYGFVQLGQIIPRVRNYSNLNSLKYPPIGRTIRCWHCWDINYPGIYEFFLTPIWTNIVFARLEWWQSKKPSHIKRSCNRIDFDCIGNMDKTDDLPMEQWGMTSRSRDLVDRVRSHVDVDRTILPWSLEPATCSGPFPPFHLVMRVVFGL